MDTDSPLDERLHAVERALTDSDRTLEKLPDAAAVADRLDEVVERLEELEARADELDASVRAVRGYVGNVRHVNREVERTAEAALAKARSLEPADGLGEALARPPGDHRPSTDTREQTRHDPHPPDSETNTADPAGGGASGREKRTAFDRVRGLLRR